VPQLAAGTSDQAWPCLEGRGRARATVTQRLCTIAGFYKYAVDEELLDHSLAAHVRRPRVDYESHATALDRNELGALLVAAGLGTPGEHALISLLALNGLRVSEATRTDIEHLGLERGHWTLTITRKGGKVVNIPLAPRTARAIELTIWGAGRRAGVPGRGRAAAWTGMAPGGSSARSPAAPGSPRPPRPTRCGTSSSRPVWMPGCRCVMCKRRRARGSADHDAV
jgi:integrase